LYVFVYRLLFDSLGKEAGFAMAEATKDCSSIQIICSVGIVTLNLLQFKLVAQNISKLRDAL
jgi:hypothetical protein